MTTSILEKKYEDPCRPFSQNELKFIRNKVLSLLKVGKTRACHEKCKHFYYVKENGRKEHEINENKNSDCGKCSVCWKIKQTPSYLINNALKLVVAYNNNFYDYPKYLTYENVDIETTYYKWLYENEVKTK